MRLREVVYTLSPFEQTVMNGLFKDLSYTVRTNISFPLRFASWCADTVCRSYTRDRRRERERDVLTHRGGIL